MTTRDMLHRLVFHYGENEITRYTAGSNKAIQSLAVERRHELERAIDYLMTRLARRDPKNCPRCGRDPFSLAHCGRNHGAPFP